MAHRPELDGIRGIAILLVLIGHTYLFGFVDAGAEGVTLFFVLSGYLITGLLLAERDRNGRVNLRSFYVRRIRRLLPGLLAMLVVTGAAVAAIGGWRPYLAQAGSALFYVANLVYAAGFDLGYLQHTWSLSVEEQFYLVWPALLLLIRSRRSLVTLAIVGIVASNLLRLVTDLGTPTTIGFRTDLRIDAVLVGCVLAMVPIPRLRFAALVGFVVLALDIAFRPSLELGIAALASAAIVAGASGVPFLTWRPLVRLGELSYGVYLWQMAPALFLRSALQAGNLLAVAAVFATAIALALISERWIERPFRRPRARPDTQDAGSILVGTAPALVEMPAAAA